MKKIFSILPLLVLTVLGYTQIKRDAARSLRSGAAVEKLPVAPSRPAEKPAMTRESLKVSSDVSGRYEFSKKMSDGTLVKQVFQLQENKLTRLRTNNIRSVSRIKEFLRNNSRSTNETEAGKEECITKETKLTADNIEETTVDYSGQAAYVYPGAVYKFDDFMKGGWNAVNAGRNPITLIASVSNTGREKPTERIESPNQATIANAKNSLYNRFTTDPKKISSEGFQFKVYEVANEAEIALKLGASGHGFGIKASALMKSADRKTHHYLLIDATKAMFSITAMPESAGLLQNPANDMMYISNVVYGSRIIAVAEVETYKSGMDAKFSGGAEYLVAGGEFDLSYITNEFGNSSKINFYVVGGQGDKISAVYSFNELKIKCDEILKTLNYHTSLPISYTLKNMNNGIVTRNSATDYFLTQSCVLPKNVSIHLRLEPIDKNETDMEIYGQVWAQLFAANGKEILPAGGKDRLLDLKDHQHLVKNSFNPFYSPQINARFNIPGSVAPGCKIIVYYWLMENDDAPNADDFLSMRNGNGSMRRYKSDNYYSTEINLDEVSGSLPCSEFVDSDGESGIKVCLSISKVFK